MARPRSETPPEFESQVPDRPVTEAGPAAWDRTGLGAHYAVPAEEEEPETHSVGGGQVLTDTVGKFDYRTGGLPLSFPAGTPVSDLPKWLAEEVMANDRLHTEG